MSSGKHHILPIICLLGAIVAFASPVARSIRGALYEAQGPGQAGNSKKRPVFEQRDSKMGNFIDHASANLKLAFSGKFFDSAERRTRRYAPAFLQQTSSFYRDAQR